MKLILTRSKFKYFKFETRLSEIIHGVLRLAIYQFNQTLRLQPNLLWDVPISQGSHCLQTCIHVIHSSYIGVSLGNLYLDVCSLLDDLIGENSSKCVPSDVTMSDINIAHRRPLTLDMLNSSSLLEPLLILHV